MPPRTSTSSSSSFPSFVDELPITQRALAFATEHHRGHRRDVDHAPFILHPLEVAQLLRGRDYPDPIVAAGVLHDLIEDTDVDYETLEERFGARVAQLVRAVSEPPGGGTYAERKARLRDAVAEADPDAVVVFAADKIAKARELRLGLVAADKRALDADKPEHYWACLARNWTQLDRTSAQKRTESRSRSGEGAKRDTGIEPTHAGVPVGRFGSGQRF